MLYFALFSTVLLTVSTGNPTSAASLVLGPTHEYDLSLVDDDLSQVSFSLVGKQYDSSFAVKTVPTIVYRPKSIDALLHARLQSLYHGQEEEVDWELVELEGPNVEDRHTLAQLARMSGDAYALPGNNNWYDLDPAWNHVRFPHSACHFSEILMLGPHIDLPVWMGR